VSDEVLNPVDIERAIRKVAERIHEGVKVVTNAEAKAREADRLHEVAVAQAYLSHEGPAHEKKYAAVLATQAEREALDLAEVEFKYADRTARALVEELRALQSVGASVRAMYGSQQ
jgi:hypothetical protein